MANLPESPASIALAIGTSIDKENRTPIMKTTGKYGSSSVFTPFHTPGSSKHKPFKILSDDEIALKTSGSCGKKVVKNVKRRSLATLQATSHGQGKLAGQGRDSVSSIKDSFMKSKVKAANITQKNIQEQKIWHDDESGKLKQGDQSDSSEVCEEKDQLVEDAIALMQSTEQEDDSYWKKIAEERRLALEETLQENEKLYDELDNLQDENERLKKVLNEAECFKLLYQNLLEQTESLKKQ